MAAAVARLARLLSRQARARPLRASSQTRPNARALHQADGASMAQEGMEQHVCDVQFDLVRTIYADAQSSALYICNVLRSRCHARWKTTIGQLLRTATTSSLHCQEYTKLYFQFEQCDCNECSKECAGTEASMDAHRGASRRSTIAQCAWLSLQGLTTMAICNSKPFGAPVRESHT